MSIKRYHQAHPLAYKSAVDLCRVLMFFMFNLYSIIPNAEFIHSLQLIESSKEHCVGQRSAFFALFE
ncbi:hypothetical protein PT226_01510 [Erysipelothrix rhusiopathiae]|nr:hypothetical protein [Erysipelothrix rhusiopathiae]MDE8339100.1 hypothetical protein [Erysipelothrix rhusiopathiae]MDV7683050.1 hypothetical protein [Erysipelothrix rhusiopathiae]UPU38741.1 hypothetical protein MX850_09020 [Erysipelothrix sp. Poltava]URQ77017.1 hypothetical protein NBX27_07110 [Erysipelothrix rhusiopathiae]